MTVVGIVAARAVGGVNRIMLAGTREFENTHAPEATSNLWKRYVGFSRAVVDYEFRLLLVATYLLLVAPIALASRLVSKPAPEEGDTTWLARTDDASMDSAGRPF
jgi:hypothetical protein